MKYLLQQFLTFSFFFPFPMARAFDFSVKTNLAIYWGQNSYGATNPTGTAHWQQPISYYCQDGTVDIFPMAFLDIFNTTGGLPSINLANSCSAAANGVFPGTQLPNCAFLSQDIKACQNAGKIVTISLGGATGAASFADDAEGQAFAQIIWDLFLGGSSGTRPFGDAVLDGIDMDIEGGTQTGFTAFLTTLRQLMKGGNKSYYITAAPQCPFPDAYIGTTLNSVPFDAVFVQFYNNYCGLNNYNNPIAWDFAAWNNWATTVSPNPNVKVFIGAPASSTAAGSGYINSSALATVIEQTRSEYPSFGGVMLWDMSQAYANDRYDAAVKAALTSGAIVPIAAAGMSLCIGTSPWQSDVLYIGGDQVIYNAHLWTAKWWAYDEVPSAPADVWVDDGPCSPGFATVMAGTPGDAAQVALGMFPVIATSKPKDAGV